jgi:hypothetical protein
MLKDRAFLGGSVTEKVNLVFNESHPFDHCFSAKSRTGKFPLIFLALDLELLKVFSHLFPPDTPANSMSCCSSETFSKILFEIINNLKPFRPDPL